MIPLRFFHDINKRCKETYGPGEKRIVGVMVARGDRQDTKQLIADHYTYWHRLSGRAFDLFWLGYTIPKDAATSGLPQYSEEDFVQGTKDLEEVCGFEYRDRIGILLFNYSGDNIQFGKYRYYDLTDLFYRRRDRLGEFAHTLIKQCTKSHDIKDVAHRLFGLRAKYVAKDVAPDVLKSLWGKAIS